MSRHRNNDTKRVERRNGRLTSELESLKKDLMIKVLVATCMLIVHDLFSSFITSSRSYVDIQADRVQRDSDVARQVQGECRSDGEVLMLA